MLVILIFAAGMFLLKKNKARSRRVFAAAEYFPQIHSTPLKNPVVSPLIYFPEEFEGGEAPDESLNIRRALYIMALCLNLLTRYYNVIFR